MPGELSPEDLHIGGAKDGELRFEVKGRDERRAL